MRRRSWVLLCSAGLAGLLVADGQSAAPATVKADRVNTRGGPSFSSEVVTQLERGESVEILESVKVSRPGAASPDTWCKILLPSNTPVWVFADFVDPASKVVIARRLNIRAGPGERYSVLGRLVQGDVVREIRVVDGWMEIEPPAGTATYVLASLLTLESKAPSAPTPTSSPAPAPAAAPKPPPAVPTPPKAPSGAGSVLPEPRKTSPPPTPQTPPTRQTPPKTAQPPAPQPPTPSPALTGRSKPPEPPRDTAPVAGVRTNSGTKLPAPPRAVASVPPPPVPTAVEPEGAPPSPAGAARLPRIIQREGLLTETISIQAPTYYKLKSSDTKRDLNFLLPGRPDLRLSQYKGQRVVVTGEEQIEPRWPGLPMIEVQKIELAP